MGSQAKKETTIKLERYQESRINISDTPEEAYPYLADMIVSI